MGHLNAKKEDMNPLLKPDELSCGAATSTGVIFENGDLGVCEFMPKDILGNLKTKKLESLWNQDTKVLMKWRSLDKVTGTCGSCALQNKCGYGCRASAFYVSEDFYGWDPLCISKPENDHILFTNDKIFFREK